MARARSRVLVSGALAGLGLLATGPAHADSSPQSTTSTTTTATTTASPSKGTSSATPSASGLPTATSVATMDPTSQAAEYVVTSLSGGDHVEGPYGADLGQTADVALALASIGGKASALDEVVTYLQKHAGDYVHGDPTRGEMAGAHYAAATGKLALVARVTGNDPTSFGGLDLVSELAGLMVTSGAVAGRFADDSTFGDYANPMGQSVDVLALERASAAGAPQAAIDYLAATQCADGGFPESFDAATCTSSPDATGLALQALVAGRAGCPASRAVTWLRLHQLWDGSFPNATADATNPTVTDVNSTTSAALGLAAAHQSTALVIAYLRSVQNPDGGLPAVPSASSASNLFATAQALAVLAHTSPLEVGPQPVDSPAPACEQRTPGASAPAARPAHGPAPTASVAPTAPAAAGARRQISRPAAAAAPNVNGNLETNRTSALTGGPMGRTTDVAPTADATVQEISLRRSARLVAAAGPLPHKGADLLTAVSAAFVLTVASLTLLLAGRRRRGRHA